MIFFQLFLIIVIYGSLVLILSSYILYPILIHFLPNRLPDKKFDFPANTIIYIIIPFYNEEKIVKYKLESSLKIKTKFKVELYAISDNSSDSTNDIILEFCKKNNNIHFIKNSQRKGKNESINRALEQINPSYHDILLFTDANTFFESNDVNILIHKLEEGAALVGGSMVYKDLNTHTAKSEGLYWKYEEWIRQNEAKRGNVVVVNGGLFAMRAEFFKQIPPYVPNDFEAPLRLVGQEFVTFTKEAKGIESSVKMETEEFQRKKRMANRQMSCILYLWKNLNFKSKLIIFFHKSFRWFGLFVFLLQALLSLIYYIFWRDKFLMKEIFLMNCVFILIMVISIILKKAPVFSKIYHAIQIHHYGFRGAMGALINNKITVWEKAATNR